MQRLSSVFRYSSLARSAISGVPARSYASHTVYTGTGGETVSRPNFTSELKSGVSTEERRTFSYFMFGVSGLTLAVGAGETVKRLLLTMNPAADVLALANIEVDLSSIAEGESLTLKWRGKPLFVRHRTQDEINAALRDDKAPLRDPQTDCERALNPKYLVVLGICTHLGCVPMSNAGDYNGYFCPCHGSHYDVSGRIRKGPAPLNLEVPPYKFLTEDQILVGESE
mmetsp:Transcript_6092/g.10079  ORF Transcript_6092/g.10079 Transcript_6092/m.10079 type:complete len:226 (+) Transcript_6092:24-701(+)